MSKKKIDDVIKTAAAIGLVTGLGYVFDTAKDTTLSEVEKKLKELFEKAEEKLSEQS